MNDPYSNNTLPDISINEDARPVSSQTNSEHVVFALPSLASSTVRFFIREFQGVQVYPIQFGVTTVGRDVRNTINFENGYVSRYHCEFILHPTGLCEIIDLDSRNGTYVNHRMITRTILQPGDLIQIAVLTFRLIFETDGDTLVIKRHKPEEPQPNTRYADSKG